MTQMNAVSNWRNSTCGGRQSYLPPKIPFPSLPPAFQEYGSNPCIPIPRPRDGQRHHQRTASEIFLLEEQPSWLDDLLNEPETPVKKATHRRSSSDSFAYVDMGNIAYNIDSLPPEGYMNERLAYFPSLGLNDVDPCKGIQYASYREDMHMHGRMHRNWMKAAPNSVVYFSHSSTRDKTPHHNKGLTRCIGEPDPAPSAEPKERESTCDMKSSPEMEGSQAKQHLPENDQKRVKQQFAQRSRVRKLQYIAELERNVQALQVEGSEVSAELQFLDQQNLILSLENKALKQRLDNLAQEQLLKHLQQEMLEREIARLRTLCQQQQQQWKISPSFHARTNSRDLDTHFTNLSLIHREANSGQDATVKGPIHI